MKINKPTFLVNEAQVRANIRNMKLKADKSNAELRPHFKTHQSAEISEWCRQEGISKITVSSMDMAKYFAEHGWNDITIAFPYNPLEHEALNDLASKVHLNVLIVSKEALDHLNQNVKAELGYFIKLDVGTHRTGVEISEEGKIRKIAESKNQKHQFKGVLVHAGHSYQPLTNIEASRIYQDSLRLMRQVKELTNQEDLIFSYGDTPTCSILEDFSEMDELRPGNFVFYDTMQQWFNACSLEEIAVCMACPVVAVHPQRNEIVVYGGGVHLSKDMIMPEGIRSFGTVVEWKGKSWGSLPIGNVVRVSQEHGIIHVSDEVIQSVKIGDVLGVLPVHSCMTADLQGYYVSLSGNRINKFNKSMI